MMENRIAGFSLVTAIFLLVVLSMLGAAMVTFFTAQQQSSALDMMGSRAYQAARAGIEWSAFQVEQSAVAGTTFAANCQGGTTTSPVTLSGTLSVFAVNVVCSASSAVEASNTEYFYNITSTATYGAAPGKPDYVQRVMSAEIEQ